MLSSSARTIAAGEALLPFSGQRDVRVQKLIGDYAIDFTPEGERLVVSFESRDKNRSGERDPWGYEFLRQQGHAVLGIKVARPDWYRGPEIHHFFSSDDLQSTLKKYRQVVFYGTSMGAYAALTFAAPGSIVLAYGPQTLLCPQRAAWDTRFPEAHAYDWDGPFADAAAGARNAVRVFVVYDPRHAIDRQHVARLDSANVTHLCAPFLGHALPPPLAKMRVLKAMLPLAISGDLTAATWHEMMRRRRDVSGYYMELAKRARNPDLVARLLARAWDRGSGNAATEAQISRMAKKRGIGGLVRSYRTLLAPQPPQPKRDAAARKARRERLAAQRAGISESSVASAG